MPSNNFFNLIPKFENVKTELLPIYKLLGLIILLLGGAILINYVPTVKIHFKFLGGGLVALGVNLLWKAHQEQNKRS